MSDSLNRYMGKSRLLGAFASLRESPVSAGSIRDSCNSSLQLFTKRSHARGAPVQGFEFKVQSDAKFTKRTHLPSPCPLPSDGRGAGLPLENYETKPSHLPSLRPFAGNQSDSG